MNTQYDLIFFGSGPGGYVAAVEAASYGLKTAIIEKAEPGGICLNWGCIPTKTLLDSVKLLDKIKKADRFGISVPKNDITFDLDKIVKRSRDMSAKLSKGVEYLLKINEISHFAAQATFLDAHTLKLEAVERTKDMLPDSISAKYIIIATGASARALPGIVPDDERIITYRKAMVPTKLPEKLAILGAGTIGVEFAYFYNSLGVEIHLFEMLPRIVPNDDPQASELLAAEFKRKKVKIYPCTMVSQVEKTETGLKLTCEAASKEKDAQKIKRPDVLEVDQLLVSVGVAPNTTGLGFENAGIELDKGFVKVDKTNASYQTNVSGIHAIGDVSGMPLLAHKASHEGIICVQWIAHNEGKRKHAPNPINYNLVPGVTFTEPEIASVGMNEESAVNAGFEVKTGFFPYSANGRAAAMNEKRGFVKLIFDNKTEKLLGGVVAGANAGEVLSNIICPLNMNGNLERVKEIMLPHPSLAEMITEAARIADGTKLM
ncbi:MAG: dihydrolipoyl dehydrogenase [Planctomycetes bacterium]|nr:dihydrolipoyl dehydrogenase [Planctomycetota bacterium]